MTWILETQLKLSSQNKIKAMIFLCHHLYEELIIEYITIKDTLILSHFFFLKKTHKKTVILSKTRYN